jgi:hypothetical protein
MAGLDPAIALKECVVKTTFSFSREDVPGRPGTDAAGNEGAAV